MASITQRARNLIDGEFGIPALYTSGKVDSDFLVAGLVREFEALKVSIKTYPSCHCSHPVIDGVLRLKEEQDACFRVELFVKCMISHICTDEVINSRTTPALQHNQG